MMILWQTLVNSIHRGTNPNKPYSHSYVYVTEFYTHAHEKFLIFTSFLVSHTFIILLLEFVYYVYTNFTASECSFSLLAQRNVHPECFRLLWRDCAYTHIIIHNNTHLISILYMYFTAAHFIFDIKISIH